jgi:hypothetical protein
MPTCDSCGSEVGAYSRFCTSCGAALAEAGPSHDASPDGVVQPAATDTEGAAAGGPGWSSEDMDPRVRQAESRHDVWALVELANAAPAQLASAQAAQVLEDLASELGTRRKSKELAYILTLESRDEFAATIAAATAALIAIGPRAKNDVYGRTGSPDAKVHAAAYFRGIGDEATAAELLADVQALPVAHEPVLAIGHAKYLGGSSNLGPTRSGDLRFTNTRVLLGTEQLLQLSCVVSIEIGGGQISKSRLVPALAFGTVGALAAKGTQDRAELAIHLDSGEAAFFFVFKRSPAEVRATLMPLLRSVGIPFSDEVVASAGPPSPPAAGAEPSSAGLVDELERLAHLHEIGFLTEAELAAAKAKLLA